MLSNQPSSLTNAEMEGWIPWTDQALYAHRPIGKIEVEDQRGNTFVGHWNPETGLCWVGSENHVPFPNESQFVRWRDCPTP